MTAAKARLFHKLQIAAHRLQRRADREIASATDLTIAQAAVLSALKERGGAAAQGEVAEALGLGSSALTAMIGRLLRLGYVTRSRDPQDGRVWRLQVSEAGAAALAASKGPFARLNRRIDRTLSQDEVAALADALDRLADAFEQE